MAACGIPGALGTGLRSGPGCVTRSGTVVSQAQALSVDAFSACVLALHTKSRELPVRAFQAFAFERIKEVIPFDSGLLARGTVQGAVPYAHDFHLDGQSPALMESWEQIKGLDKVTFETVGNPGHSRAYVTSEVYADAPPVLAHCERFSIRHLLSTASIAQRAGSYGVLSLYRHDVAHPFSEAERAMMELLVPHVWESSRQAHLTSLRNVTRAPAQAAHSAIINRIGIVLEAEPAFVDLLAQRFPEWNGPGLPRSLLELAKLHAPERRSIGTLTFWVDPSSDVSLVRARALLPVDSLSDRERKVAELFASGESTKETAHKLGIAANTVRVHVSRIYEKLGVVNKAELASMLAGLE